MGRIFEPAPSRHKLEESPDEAGRFREGLSRIEAEKQRALDDPGPSWHDWWYYSASRWYVVLVFFVVDAWIVGSFLSDGYLAILFTAVAIYLEVLLYQYLYYRPRGERRRRGETFRRTWYRPFEFGRWTPEGAALRAGGGRVPSEAIPSPDEGPTTEEFF